MNDTKVIKNGQIVLENGILWDGIIIIHNDNIVSVGNKRDTYIPIGAQIIDAKGAYVGPGFIDIHVHGGGGYSTCYDLKNAAEFFLYHGSTSILATPDYHMNRETTLEVIRNIKSDIDNLKSVKGIYMEGPYTNPIYGSHSDTNPWKCGVSAEDYIPIVDEAGKYAKVWTIAPEREDLKPFLEYARKVNPEVVFAVGHSCATPMQIRALGKFRPTLETHAMNATKRIPVCSGTRGYGPDEYCFKETDVYCELISDSCGTHVHPELQQLLLHNKGIERVVLITDSTTHVNPTPENLRHVVDLNFDPNGGLAGSKMTMDCACRNIMTNTNCGIAQAFYMAATTPSRAIGIDSETGSICIGKRADLVFVDDKFNVQQVMLEGEVVV